MENQTDDLVVPLFQETSIWVTLKLVLGLFPTLAGTPRLPTSHISVKHYMAGGPQQL
jgi:hypothetical protein